MLARIGAGNCLPRMTLDPEEVALFYKLTFSLMSFVNKRERLLLDADGGIADFEDQLPDEKHKVHQALYADRAALIDAYLAENPDRFGKEELAEIASWKAAVTDTFFTVKQLKAHMVMIPGRENPPVYAVVGLHDPISLSRPPVLMETTLLPFRGKIVYDGLVRLHGVSFGAGVKSSLNEVYREAKARGRVLTRMVDSPLPRKKKKPTAKQRIAMLAAELRGKIAANRRKRHDIARFRGEVLPKFGIWTDENMGEEKARMKELMEELETLAEALDRMRMEWNRGVGKKRTRAQVADSVLEKVKLERERERMERDGEDPSEAGDEAEDGGGDDADDGFPGGMPDLGANDFMLDFMFGEFMQDMRGINVADMSEEDYEKARAQFFESVDHAKSGDTSAFEKAMHKVGADESPENVEAVKKAFRRLARKLHPDGNKDYGDEAKELWEELGAAKKALDLKTIERLELHWRIVREEELSPSEGAALKDFSGFLEADAEDLDYDESRLMDHPIWPHRNDGFSEQVAKETRERMDRDIEGLLGEKQELEDMIEKFRSSPERKKTTKGKPKKKR